VTVLLGVVLAGLGGAQKGAKPPVVRVSRAAEKEVASFADFTGRLEATAQVEIRPQVSGLLQAVRYKAGAVVKKGDVLFELDDAPYRAALEAAEGGLALAEARRSRIEADYQRARVLLPRKATSREDFDRIAGARAEAEAEVKVARAQLAIPRLFLAYTRVTAPRDGTISSPLRAAGDLVWPWPEGAGVTPLALLVPTDPVYVWFDVDEGTLLRHPGLQRRLGKEKLPIRVGVAGEKGFPRTGTLDYVGVRVDPRTKTAPLRGVLANRDGALLPGMSARVRLRLGGLRKVLLAPEGAVQDGKGTSWLWVVKEGRAERRKVDAGEAIDGQRVIASGLKPGEWVVTSGAKGLRPGALVEAKRGPASPAR
jgi:RND family efflux transporter MFP subunit